MRLYRNYQPRRSKSSQENFTYFLKAKSCLSDSEFNDDSIFHIDENNSRNALNNGTGKIIV